MSARMHDSTLFRTLFRHMRDLVGPMPGTSAATDSTRSILADPQAHVDALVAAGVLRITAHRGHGDDFYGIVQPDPPHVHSWRVVGPTQADRSDSVLVGCRGCRVHHWVDNNLPIDVPS